MQRQREPGRCGATQLCDAASGRRRAEGGANGDGKSKTPTSPLRDIPASNGNKPLAIICVGKTGLVSA